MGKGILQEDQQERGRVNLKGLKSNLKKRTCEWVEGGKVKIYHHYYVGLIGGCQNTKGKKNTNRVGEKIKTKKIKISRSSGGGSGRIQYLPPYPRECESGRNEIIIGHIRANSEQKRVWLFMDVSHDDTVTLILIVDCGPRNSGFLHFGTTALQILQTFAGFHEVLG